MNTIRNILTEHAKAVLVVGVSLLIGAGIYGFGLFASLNDGSDNFFAKGTPAELVNETVNDVFGTDETKASILLFEAKDRKANVRETVYANEASSIMKKLRTTSVTSYYTTGSDGFISRDGSDTYAVVTLEGTNEQQFNALTDFSDSVKSDKFTVSVGGALVGQHQTLDQVKTDLAMAEMISLPILALLLFLFFRGPVAAAIPLIMSALTIAGALAVTRIIHMFVPIDSYTLNVITILGVGLSVDYSLLAVNRFREELSTGVSAKEAAQKTVSTAGRTVFFSGITVIICLLALLIFPVGFMVSVSIGGAAAVLVAVLISTFLLPPALQLIGKNINKWSMKPRTKVADGWHRLATQVTKRPYVALAVGAVVIGLFIWPVTHFETKTFDWRVLPSNQSAYRVGQVMSEHFDLKVPSITVMAQFETPPTVEQLCRLSETISASRGIEVVQGAYTPMTGLSDCTTMPYVLSAMKFQAPETYALLEASAMRYTKDNYALVEAVSIYEASDARIRDVISSLQKTDYGTNVTVSLTGTAPRSQDTLDVYRTFAPYVIGVIAVAMVVVLGLLLGSVILPLQAIVINSIALFISLGVMVMVFQFGWGTDLLSLGVSGGFELSIPILIFVIAFGLSMDYSVFLYSRMHEVYDSSSDPREAIIEGVTKTGPIITAAALLLFVVVSAFATSRIVIIQQVGIGLATAVLVDAFFVRIVLVPAIMRLFGKASWWGPKWLKKLTIKHD